MRYQDLSNPLTNMDILLHECEVEYRKLNLAESTDFHNAIEAHYEKFDKIKISNPVIGDKYWTLEIAALVMSDFVTLVKSDTACTFIDWYHVSKFPNSNGMKLEYKGKNYIFPLLTSYLNMSPSIIDTFLFSSEADRDQFLVEMRLSLPENTRFNIQEPRV
jgi:hypothetical protein